MEKIRRIANMYWSGIISYDEAMQLFMACFSDPRELEAAVEEYLHS